MIKVEKNSEIENIINILTNNFLAKMKHYEVIEKCKKQLVTPALEKELLTMYKGFGYEPKTLKLSASEFYDMPYNKNIRLDLIKDENIEIKYYELKKGRLEPIDFGNRNNYNKDYNRLAYYDKDIQAPTIVEKGETWMSPTMAERNTMKNAINKATGDVLTFGLGIGYFPYNCLLKDDVTSVTIVERNPKIIEIFTKYILPQFNIDKPVYVIEGDLFDYYNDYFLSKYDYTFVDVWKNEEDGIWIYRDMMKCNVKYENIDYWIEDTLLYTLQDMVIMYLKALFDGNLTKKISYFNEDGDETKLYIKMVHKYFRGIDKVISTADEILFYINDKTTLQDILRVQL